MLAGGVVPNRKKVPMDCLWHRVQSYKVRTIKKEDQPLDLNMVEILHMKCAALLSTGGRLVGWLHDKANRARPLLGDLIECIYTY